MNRIKMNGTFKTLGVLLTVAIVACGLVLPQQASAALPAPNWLPGQPMLAGTQIIAMWLPIPGAVKYILYQNGEKMAESPANQYIGIAPIEAGEYAITVSAVDASGAEGPRSKAGVIKIVALEPPTDILTRVDQKNKWVLIRWSKPTGAVISNVYKSVGAPGNWQLLSSIQEQVSFKDVDVEYGNNYYYSISGKDITGKEGPKSEPIMVAVEEPIAEEIDAVDSGPPVEIVIKTSEMIGVKRDIGIIPAQHVTENVYVPETGEAWFTSQFLDLVVVLNADGDVVREFDILALLSEKSPSTKWRKTYGIAVLPDDDIFVLTDPDTSQVLCLSTDGEFQWVVKVQPPTDDRDDLWQYIPEKAKKRRPSPIAPFFLDPDTLWVSEARGPFVYVIDVASEELVDWWSGYTDQSGNHNGSAGIGNFFRVDDDTVWAGESFSHRAVAFSPADDRLIKYSVGTQNKKGYLGGLLGVSGFIRVPDGNILIPDSGFGSLQVFSKDTGEYLYHIGNESGMPDESVHGERAVLGAGPVQHLFFDGNGVLWVRDNISQIYRGFKVNW